MRIDATPEKWAYQITHVLNATLGTDHFPIDVALVAKEYSAKICPDDPVSLVKGKALPGFEGGLFPAPPRRKGWGIFYNSAISSPGRINFTLAHELGHYLLHREKYPQGKECVPQDVIRWDSEYGQIEHQANQFAAFFLMPLDDYRHQISENEKPTLDSLGACADRYNVSLIAVTLRWLSFTLKRACLVVSRDGFILWARSSKRAFKSGIFFKTSGHPPVPIPDLSLANDLKSTENSRAVISHGAGVWFEHEECEERVLVSEQYDFTISLLLFSDTSSIYRWKK